MVAAGKWGRVLLLEYVFLEVVTVLRARLGPAESIDVGSRLLESEEFTFIPCSELFSSTFDVFRDQVSGRLSFTDAAIVVAARQFADGRVATFDRDFHSVPGLTIVPS